MAKIKINYNGMELEEFTSDKPVIFDPPKKCVVWYDDDRIPKEEVYVLAYESRRIKGARVIGIYNQSWGHCAFIPENPAPRRATWMEVAKWCATGNGLVYDTNRDKIDTGIMFKPDIEHEPIMDELKVRKWDDTEWHFPDVEYMGITEVKTYEDVVKKGRLNKKFEEAKMGGMK